MKKTIFKQIFLTILLANVGFAMADEAPVVDAYQYENGSQGQLSITQRLQRIEQQITNQQNQGIPSKIQQLQSEIQTLRGEIQAQANEINQLNKAKMAKSQSNLPISKITPTNAAVKKLTDNSTSVPTKVSRDDQKVYNKAYTLITKQNYPQAMQGMRTYLKNFPQGKLASNAHYWLGEIYLLQNNDRAALQEFTIVINQFPQSYKYQDALLKLGFIYYDNGQLEAAKQKLQQVVNKYPNSTVAKLARSRLNDINQQINAH